MDIVVFGAGSIGSLLGGLLANEHDVTLVGRQPHVDHIRDEGLTVEGLESMTVWPQARTSVGGCEADLALVTVKSYDTDAAAAALGSASFDVVCSVQNGLSNEARLAEELSVPVLGGTTTYGATLVEPGVVNMTGDGTVTIGWYRGGTPASIDHIATAFETAGITVDVSDDIDRTLWHKLAINAAINPVTALARVRNGALADGPLAALARSAGRETVAVADEHGVSLDESTVLADIESVARDTASNHSSMLQDIQRNRRTEIDAINGAVVDRAKTVDVPVNEALLTLIKEVEISPTDPD